MHSVDWSQLRLMCVVTFRANDMRQTGGLCSFNLELISLRDIKQSHFLLISPVLRQQDQRRAGAGAEPM